MIPMPAASPTVKSPGNIRLRPSAPRNAAKIPIYAAAPRIIVFLFAISGEKSVVAPIPTKIRHG